MESLATEKFLVPDASREALRNMGFHGEGEGLYVKKFSAYKYNNETTLEAVLKVYEDDRVIHLDLCDMDGTLYAPFYSGEDDNEVVQIANRKILNVFRNMHVTHRKKKNIYRMDKRNDNVR